MKSADYASLRKLPDGTLFTYDSPDTIIRHAVFELGIDEVMTSQGFQVYEKDDLEKLAEKIEAAIELASR